MIVYENTQKRVEVGYLSSGVFGIKAYADDGSTPIFEASDTQKMLAGWDFTDTTLSSANISLVSGANPLITVGGNADWKIEIGGTAGSEYIGSSTFTSGPLGQGWKIDSTTGRIEVQDIVARGKLSMAVFEYATISAVGGNLLVTESDVLAVDMTAADASTLTIDGDVTFSVNDILRIKDGVDNEWLQVTNIASAPQYTVTRDLSASYGANANPAWKKGTAVVSTGTTNSGYIHMDASSANSPYIDIVLRNSLTYSDLITKVRLGNLDGISDTDFGIAPSGFGLFTDNVFLKGTIVTSTGAGQRITINEYKSGAFNNAMILYDVDNDDVVRIDDGLGGASNQPGILVTKGDGTAWITTDEIVLSSRISQGTAGIMSCQLDNRTPAASYDTALSGNCVSDLVDTNPSYARRGILGQAVIGHGSSTTPAVGVWGIATNAGSGNATGIYGYATSVSGDAYAGYFAAGDVYIADDLGVGTATIPHGGIGTARLAIEGANASVSSPIIQFTTATDDYPLLQIFPWSHDIVRLVFDAYFMSGVGWRSSDAGSNAMISKTADKFIISYDSGIAQGNPVAWNDGFAMDLTNGNVGININAPTAKFTTAGVIQAARTAFSVPTGVGGLEFSFRTDDKAYIDSYDRNAAAYRPLIMGASSFYLLQGNVGISDIDPTILLSVNGKGGITAEGGHAIRLTNKTAQVSVKGELAAPSVTDANAYRTAAANADDVIGIVYESGIADGSEVWIVQGGIADVLMDAGGSTLNDRLISSSSVPGSADVWNTGGAVATHFQEIGHSLESRVGAGLIKAVIHFN